MVNLLLPLSHIVYPNLTKYSYELVKWVKHSGKEEVLVFYLPANQHCQIALTNISLISLSLYTRSLSLSLTNNKLNNNVIGKTYNEKLGCEYLHPSLNRMQVHRDAKDTNHLCPNIKFPIIIIIKTSVNFSTW